MTHFCSPSREGPSSTVSPSTLNKRPSVLSPTGTLMPLPVAMTSLSRCKPSLALSIMQLDKGSVVAEGTPFELKNDYVQDIVSVYGVSEDEIKTLNREYKKIRDGYQIKVKNTKEATELIVEHQDLFTDYEVVKGGMDDVFLAVTGKKLGGER